MKKKILIALILIAIPIYLWNFRLVLVAFNPATQETEKTGKTENNKHGIKSFTPHNVKFIDKGRSPFLAYKEKPAPNPVLSKPVKPAPKPIAVINKTPRPAIFITGIMWNETQPLVMLQLSDNSSTVAKAGQTLTGGIKVVTIEKTRVEFEFGGEKFWQGK